MRVLVACEYSARVRDAFRRRGHDAWSCDFEPCEGDPTYHFQGDVFDFLKITPLPHWDLLIAHPPCTYLCNSGVRWLYDKTGLFVPERWADMYQGAMFFKRLWELPIPRIAIENPVMHSHAQKIIGCDWTQSIQPWQFGHMEQKRTCLWLKNLPVLKPTWNVKDMMMTLPEKERAKVHHAPPGKLRWKFRSRTFFGIADAFGEQWGLLQS